MDKFIVSARKYRPQTFATVIGQAHITTTLKNAIKNEQLAHAFLFCGPRGVGKTTCARILAKTINCESQKPDGEACNTCQSCVSFNEGSSLNIHELDAASNNSVDDIRNLVDQVRFPPQAGRYKVYIIDEVHMLSASAFNAFLKTLEEPPPYAIFILATTEKHKILPTILSRCQIFDFKRITTNDTVEHLEEIMEKENIRADKAALQIIAQKSEGCMRDALSILDKIVSFTNGEVSYTHTLEHLNILDADYYFKMSEGMQAQDLSGVLLLYDDIIKKGFEEELVLGGLSDFFRNLLISKDKKIAQLLEVVESFRDRYVHAAKQVGAGFILSALNILNEAEIHFKSARNKRLHVELVLIRLTYLMQAIELTETEGTMQKKKLIDTAKPVSFRALPVLREHNKPAAKPRQQEARLTIQSPGPVHTTALQEDPAATIQEENYSVVQEPPEVPRDNRPQHPVQEKKPAQTIQLKHIRQQIADRANKKAETVIPLDMQQLTASWKQYSELLKANKNPAAQSFDLATLQITSESSFEVITNNNLEQKFIEQEKRMLSEHLQKAFCNKLLNFSVKISENPLLPVEENKVLSKKDQYLMMIQQYPLVKELKDKLKLELDY